MKRNVLNIIIDAVSLVVFMSMISTGILLKFVLPPGSGRIEKLIQQGGRFEKTIDVCLGLTRHEWGEIHFCISLVFLILLTIHLCLHWNWIMAMSFGVKGKPQPLKRRLIALGIVLFVIFSLVFPWIVKKQTFTKTEIMKLRSPL